MYNFRNSILIVAFNSNNSVKDIIKQIYKVHFKEIIFYSDYSITKDKEINYINTNKGFNAHGIFNHFYNNYKTMIDDCDGVFYTTDDTIINVNILNLFNSDKIIFYYNELKPLDEYSGWWWDTNYNGKYGKDAINNLIMDNDFKTYNMNTFSGCFSNFFYLPKKYLTDTLFHLFDLFYKYEVFFEISIPTIINYIENDSSRYQTFTDEILWTNKEKFLNKDYIYNSLNHNHNFILYPIKVDTFEFNIFSKEKCIIITTTNKPSEGILKHIKNSNYDVIIVGDKTPDYKNLKCIYLDIYSQKKLFPELSDLLPYDHYSRKNLGYLYAIKKGYKTIYETQDDSIPHDNFDSIVDNKDIQIIREQQTKWINIFKYFTKSYIWPRGLPLNLIKNKPNYLIESTDEKPSIINGLVENIYDVDTIYKLVCNNDNSIKWDKNKSILIDNKNVCLFNAQNTFWVNSELFICLLIPSSVSFRYCDVLRGIIDNIILKKTNNYMMYSSPNSIQTKNENNLIYDLKHENEMFMHNEIILDYIEKRTVLYIIQAKSGLPEIYECLRNRDFVLLSYQENASDTTIFYPNSTWTSGRNKLREYILTLTKKYDYYIFLDEDVTFSGYSQEDGFNHFEELITLYNPFIATPNYGNYYIHYTYNNDLPLGEAQTTIWFDSVCNAFSKEAFFSDILFPYMDMYDDRSWQMSQFIMIMLCSIYNKQVILFNNFKLINNIHGKYPKMHIFDETEQYILNSLKENEQCFGLDLNWDKKEFKEKLTSEKINIKNELWSIYNNLLHHGVIKENDIEILHKWFEYF